MKDYYLKSIKQLKKVLKQKDMTRQEWDEYASTKGFFGSMVLMDKSEVQDWEIFKKKIKHKIK